MSVFERDKVSLYYEVHGEGFPLVLFAPGGMRSAVEFWRATPMGDPKPWSDPMTALSDTFTVIGVDQRNAGRSHAPVSANDSWDVYVDDTVALLDHLEIDRVHAMGGCIGSSYVLALIQRIPDRVAAGVLQNPIGRSADNAGLFRSMFDGWATEIRPDHPEADESSWTSFRERMFAGDFVFSVPRPFVAACPVPLLVLPGADQFHPRPVALEIAEIAPDAELLDEWAGADQKASTTEKTREFLLRHTPE
jgi:pimeloyl-ACP methyl ester carboxylesterase